MLFCVKIGNYKSSLLFAEKGKQIVKGLLAGVNGIDHIFFFVQIIERHKENDKVHFSKAFFVCE